jgi:hypothetical protein
MDILGTISQSRKSSDGFQTVMELVFELLLPNSLANYGKVWWWLILDLFDHLNSNVPRLRLGRPQLCVPATPYLRMIVVGHCIA